MDRGEGLGYKGIGASEWARCNGPVGKSSEGEKSMAKKRAAKKAKRLKKGKKLSATKTLRASPSKYTGPAF
jgi:hypothetical protein